MAYGLFHARIVYSRFVFELFVQPLVGCCPTTSTTAGGTVKLQFPICFRLWLFLWCWWSMADVTRFFPLLCAFRTTPNLCLRRGGNSTHHRQFDLMGSEISVQDTDGFGPRHVALAKPEPPPRASSTCDLQLQDCPPGPLGLRFRGRVLRGDQLLHTELQPGYPGRKQIVFELSFCRPEY